MNLVRKVMMFQILDDNRELVSVTAIEWTLWAATEWEKRIVKQETVMLKSMDQADIYISTVYTLDGKFETLYAGDVVEHYTSWAEAEAGHAKWVKHAKESDDG